MFNIFYSAWKLFQPKQENLLDWSLKKKASKTVHGYIWYFKWHICIKNIEFWKVLEQIRALYANKDGQSYIRVVFRELHSEKQPLDENKQNYIQSNHIQKNHNHLSYVRKLYTEIN